MLSVFRAHHGVQLYVPHAVRRPGGGTWMLELSAHGILLVLLPGFYPPPHNPQAMFKELNPPVAFRTETGRDVDPHRGRERRLRLYPAADRGHGGQPFGTTGQAGEGGLYRNRKDLPREDALHGLSHHGHRARCLRRIRRGVADLHKKDSPRNTPAAERRVCCLCYGTPERHRIRI